MRSDILAAALGRVLSGGKYSNAGVPSRGHLEAPL